MLVNDRVIWLVLLNGCRCRFMWWLKLFMVVLLSSLVSCWLSWVKYFLVVSGWVLLDLLFWG